MKSKPIDGFENYTISEDGIVVNVKTGRVIKIKVDAHGYKYFIPYCKGKGFSRKIHRLVALAFLPNPDPLSRPHINHIDGNKLNNHISNLEWVSAWENNRHAIDMGLRPTTQKQRDNSRQVGYNNRKLVLDITSGIFYEGLQSAVNALGLKTDCKYLSNKLTGYRKNNTPLRYI